MGFACCSAPRIQGAVPSLMVLSDPASRSLILHIHTVWYLAKYSKGLLCRISDLILRTLPFFLVPCPTNSSHLSSCGLQPLFPPLSKTTVLCELPFLLLQSERFSRRKAGMAVWSPHLSPFLSELSPVCPVVQHLKRVISHIFSSFTVVYWGGLEAFTLLMARSMYSVVITEGLLGYPISISSSIFSCLPRNCRD